MRLTSEAMQGVTTINCWSNLF